ncbi:hypothetical protein QE152_g9533 [Popillia japonica]|uniref:Uncharacterized protein n=1 Tax=Popillia japonica TaxID=7064 RepID=A0AAW1LX54_POPJA
MKSDTLKVKKAELQENSEKRLKKVEEEKRLKMQEKQDKLLNKRLKKVEEEKRLKMQEKQDKLLNRKRKGNLESEDEAGFTELQLENREQSEEADEEVDVTSIINNNK